MWLNQMTGFNQRPGQALRDGSSERSGWQLLLAITEALILFSKSEHVMCPSLGHVASTLLDLEVRRLSCSHAVWAAGYHFPLSKQMISAPTPHPKHTHQASRAENKLATSFDFPYWDSNLPIFMVLKNVSRAKMAASAESLASLLVSNPRNTETTAVSAEFPWTPV